MHKIVFHLTYPLLYLISFMPMRILYLLSALLYLVGYKIFGYRKKVVFQNISNAFPEYTTKEVRTIANRFYVYLFDTIVETIKLETISKSALNKMCSCENMDVLNRLYSEGRSVIVASGHYGNWEYVYRHLALNTAYNEYVLYKPLKNPYFDNSFYRSRTRFGTRLIAAKAVFKEMLKLKDELGLFAFISDQTPSPKRAFWMDFLNQDTPVFQGIEVVAKKFNYPVVYMRTKVPKRGKYVYSFELIHEAPLETEEMELTVLHTKMLEADILAEPAFWLWSHKRWKHKRMNVET